MEVAPQSKPFGTQNGMPVRAKASALDAKELKTDKEELNLMPKRSKTRLTVILMILSIMLLCFGLVACGGTKTYKVTLDYDSKQGSVELSPKAEDNKYKEGTELTVTVTPNEGYVLDTFKLSTEDRNATPDNTGKFVFKVEEDTTITVTFKSTTPSAEKYGVAKNSRSGARGTPPRSRSRPRRTQKASTRKTPRSR